MYGFGNNGFWGNRYGSRGQSGNPNDPIVGIEPWQRRPQPNYGPFNGGALPQQASSQANPFMKFFERFSQAPEGYSSPIMDLIRQLQSVRPPVQTRQDPFAGYQGFGSTMGNVGGRYDANTFAPYLQQQAPPVPTSNYKPVSAYNPSTPPMGYDITHQPGVGNVPNNGGGLMAGPPQMENLMQLNGGGLKLPLYPGGGLAGKLVENTGGGFITGLA